MQFRTQIPIISRTPKLDYDSKVLLLGSCFVENIGKKLEYFKYTQFENPLGIFFHPAAILNLLKRVKSGDFFSEENLFFHNEFWRTYEAHSSMCAEGKEQLLQILNAAISQTRDFLAAATHIIITPGTAWAYREKTSEKLVANCHKMAQGNFSKELTEVKNTLFETLEIIKELNPEARVIFTVSPVRHLKDGFIENQISKAHLITAVHEVVASEAQADYFPAYEIMMDELRDYRFYAEDMLHPNAIAIDYIWEKFEQAWISSEASAVMKRVDTIQKGLLHRPFAENSEAHQKFRSNLQQKIEALEREVSTIKF